MLSLANVGGSREAGHYYEKADDYYTQDRSPSRWQGKAAEALNLSEEVRANDFRKLLDGVLPNGEMIHIPGAGRRGGTDLTFSAPKSISMQALIGGDLRLIDAHDRAVAKSLTYAETLAGYRQTVKGETGRVSSHNIATATFRHELSRACDPQLHTHSVVLNLTQRSDGTWRAIDNEPFYRQSMLMGCFYRAELAREVQSLGYEVRVTHRDGRFELGHITDRQIETFSSRSRSIEEALEKKGKTRETASPKEKDIFAIATRPKKTETDRKVLREYWREKSREAGIDYRHAAQVREMSSFSRLRAVETVGFAVDHLMERQAVVTQDKIIRESLQHGVGLTTYEEIQSEMSRRVKAGLLIRSGDRYTTPEAIACEKIILKIEKQGRTFSRSVLEKETAQKWLKEKSLNAGQREAVQLILTSLHQIVGIQGLAGTGKTFMLETARELAERQNFKIIGLAPSAAAAQELGKTGIESRTIASFESASEKSLSSKTILVVDEAGMVSTRQMESLLKTAQKYHSKIVLIGDTQQLKAVEAGKPFAQLQAHGMATAGMSEIQRQKNPELKKAVELAASGQVRESVALLQKSVSEIATAQERYERIARDYVSLPIQDREKTLIVSGTNEARREINQKVREGLGLRGKGEDMEVSERKDLTKAELKQLKNYQIGDLVRAEKNYRSLNWNSGDAYRVHAVKRSYVVLQRGDGSLIHWNPHQKTRVSVYRLEKKEIVSGEIVRITRNDRQMGINNGDRAQVIKIDPDKSIHLRREDGKIFRLDGSKPLHLEYGYCSTVHAAQGKTCERVLIEADTKSLTSANDNYYVAISRAKQEARIYTDDRHKLPVAMNRENVKETALEIEKV